MFPKLLTLLLSFAVLAVALLVLRQQRIHVAHELSAIHQATTAHDTMICELRVELARTLAHPPEPTTSATDTSPDTPTTPPGPLMP